MCWFLLTFKLNSRSVSTSGYVLEVGSYTRKGAIDPSLTCLSRFHGNSRYRELIGVGQPWRPQYSMKESDMSDNIHANASIRIANMIVDE